MSLRARLVILVVLVALGPLALSAWMALRVHQRAFDGQAAELSRRAAEHEARLTAGDLAHASRSLSLLANQIEWGRLDEAERQGALALVYGLDDDVALASLLDEKGAGVGPSALARGDPARVRHPDPSMATLSRFAEAIPFARAIAVEEAVQGGPVAGDGAEAPLVPIALSVRGPEGTRWAVVVGLSLRGVCAGLAGNGTGGLEVLLVDGGGRLLCPPGALGAPDAGLAKLPAGVGSYRDAGGRALRAARAALPNGWAVVAQQPEEIAGAPSRLIRAQALWWLGLSALVALGAGLMLARRISRPVAALVSGAATLARGELSHRLPEKGGDELSRLAGEFNRMAVEIERRDREIRSWNEELQKRVEERTGQLKEAQQQLLQSQKLAAVSALGAGFAHEINNPLTSVIGNAQLVLARLRGQIAGAVKAEMVEDIERDGLRIQQIVGRLLALSGEYGGSGYGEVEVKRLFEEALEAVGPAIAAAGIELRPELDGEVPPLAGNADQLREVLRQLLRNAVTAMAKGGRLSVSAVGVDGQAVKLTVADTGAGIAPELLARVFEPFFTTKDDWKSQGLGLTFVHRIVEQHSGQVKIDSRVGEGTTVYVTLPAAVRGSHLV
jgi:two-component system NtrC family sensor kinase